MSSPLMALYLDLAALAPEARPAALSSVTDPDLRGRLARMLAVDPSDRRLDPEGGPAPAVAREIAALLARPPEALGPFRVLRELGRGGMGVVYEGEETLPRRVVALKTLLEPSPSPEAIRRFEEECSAMAAVDHPVVPRVYQVFRDAGRPVMAMELVRGEPFVAGIGPLSFDDRIRMLIELARAVHAIHRVGIVHRDLKPANLLVGRGGMVRILDFGIASEGATFVPGSGTLAYMPPEQRAGAAPHPVQDVYSLGALAMRVLCGGADDSDATWAGVLDTGETGVVDVAAQAPTLPASLAAVLAAALHADPLVRTPTAEAFADELDGWLEAELLRMLSAAVPEAGPAGAGAVRRRAVDSTLAVVRRTLASGPTERQGPPLPHTALRTLGTWLAEGTRAVSVYGLPGSGADRVVKALLDEVGDQLTVAVHVRDEPWGPLGAALGTSASSAEVVAALRGLGAAVVGVIGHASVGEVLAPLLPLAPDVRWVVASPARVTHPGFRPLQLDGLSRDEATTWVAGALARHGVDVTPEDLSEAVAHAGGVPALLEALVARALVVGGEGLGSTPLSELGAPWRALMAPVRALDVRDQRTLATLSHLPVPVSLRDARSLLDDGAWRLDALVDRALVRRDHGRVAVSRVVRTVVEEVVPQQVREAARAPWLAWIVDQAGRAGRAWIDLAPGMEQRFDTLAPHVAAAAPHLAPEALHHVAAELADGLSLLGHRPARAVLDEAVLAATPDPTVSRDASLAWVHAIMRRHRRGDLQAVPMLAAIRAVADDRDGNLLSQAAHVEASRHPPGHQEPVVTLMEATWARLRAGGQEAWGAWMVAAQAPVSKGMGLPGEALLRLAEDAVASIRTEAAPLARCFAQQALSFAWIDFGRLEAGARLGEQVSTELARSGHERVAASFATYLGKVWWYLGDLERAELFLRRAVSHGTQLHPPHALQWLGLLALARGRPAEARAHLAEAERRMPHMEHALLHHHRLCTALLAHAEGRLTEARPRYRALVDGSMNLSATRRGAALVGLLRLSDSREERAATADALRAEARRDADAWPFVRHALGDDGPEPPAAGAHVPLLAVLARLAPTAGQA
ncbi:MAG: protein kinase [Alphaproteobacteria bacterium]|nr:protein kinase [Alphaproteobacteria bacterium]